MKLREVIEECIEVKDYLQDLVGNDDRVDMGLRFENLQLVYIMPEIYEKDIDDVAKKCFPKENGRYVIKGQGVDCIANLKAQISKFESRKLQSDMKKAKKSERGKAK